MSVIGSNVLAGASGAAGGGGPLYVDDVFSTYLYEGTGAAKTITNGIDLAGEGGLVWIKQRDESRNHSLYDTERGVLRQLYSNSTNGQGGASGNDLDGFNSNGFSLGTDTFSLVNKSGGDYASWTFRKQKGFFDVVTWTGNNSSGLRSISHNLGSTPAFIITKNVSGGNSWNSWHKDLTSKNYYLALNDTGAQGNAGTQIWDATDTTFSIHSGIVGNASGTTYIAYLFASDDAQFGTDGDESIIKCGGYTGTGSAGNFINLGFEPQWVMIKRTNDAGHWMIFDAMRGIPTGSNDSFLLANLSNAESSGADYLSVNPTGFTLESNAGDTNGSGKTFIYMAIRRPNKPPTAATDVFAVTYGNSSGPSIFTSGFPVDFAFWKTYGSVSDFYLSTRLLGSTYQVISAAGTENGYSPIKWDHMDSWESVLGASYISHMFKRAPGFVDVVAYNGANSDQTLNHNLETTPDMVIVKRRDGSGGWVVSMLNNESTYLNEGDDFYTPSYWIDNLTATTFRIKDWVNTNYAGNTYIAYLFGSLDGISKVGSYNGYTGNAVDVNCGFTNGARFILIKRSDADSDWYLWDTVRGIASGDDPYLLLNSNAAQVTNTDYIDPLSTGFTVTSSAPAALNATGGTYLFLAIA